MGGAYCDLAEAPLFTELTPGPADGTALWVKTADGMRIRVGAWGRDAKGGTVLLFPGRTEYVEKYADAARELAARGFATLAIDWRGQGLAQRMAGEARVGHVLHFTDYQHDVAAALRAARALDMPQPWFLLAHSMGGAIGLRAVMEGLPVHAAAFSGPMWGIHFAPHLRVPARVLAYVMPRVGLGERLPPGTRLEHYVQTDPFEDNMLTRDRAMHDMMRDHLEQRPELALGGPSYHWLREALTECALLARRPSPGLSCVTYLGSNERIVNTSSIRDRMARWPSGRLVEIEDGEHEVMMEVPATRKRVFDDMAAFFDEEAV